MCDEDDKTEGSDGQWCCGNCCHAHAWTRRADLESMILPCDECKKRNKVQTDAKETKMFKIVDDTPEWDGRSGSEMMRTYAPMFKKSVLRGLTKEKFEELLRKMKVTRVEMGATLFTEGHKCDVLYLLEDGAVALSQHFKPKETVVANRNSVQVLDLPVFLGKKKFTMTAKVMSTKAAILELKREGVDKMSFTLGSVIGATALDRLKIFKAALPDEIRSRLGEAIEYCDYAEGEVLVEPGAWYDSITIVEEGKLNVVDAKGKTTEIQVGGSADQDKDGSDDDRAKKMPTYVAAWNPTVFNCQPTSSVTVISEFAKAWTLSSRKCKKTLPPDISLRRCLEACTLMDHLRRVPLFSKFSYGDERFRTLCMGATPAATYQMDERLFYQGEVCPSLQILMEGTVQIIVGQEEKMKMTVKGPDRRLQNFGEWAIAERVPRRATVQVKSKIARVFEIPSHAIDDIYGGLEEFLAGNFDRDDIVRAKRGSVMNRAIDGVAKVVASWENLPKMTAAMSSANEVWKPIPAAKPKPKPKPKAKAKGEAKDEEPTVKKSRLSLAEAPVFRRLTMRKVDVNGQRIKQEDD
eukprot:gnl/TRDRNA2_/TRDRNA2_137154_c2_seq1.p1 gnl/TRDRNA2_/TRDRNA2_137154_c2~~gnl/TRDRNA2_/TRDRNA2_137154_c2_seq1.p1  ORF type:complete len:610 (-),score=130.78 gnl/TRDRNA2_/TRDRNA2_137154_c2_seq1:517-2250(-)